MSHRYLYKKSLIRGYLFCSFILLFNQLNGLTFSVDYYERQRFTPSDNIRLEVTLFNEKSDIESFYLSDNKIFNLEFEVKNEYSSRLPSSQSYLNAFSNSRNTYYRQIDLYPNEKYSFSVNLNDFVNLTDPGVYVISTTFFTSLIAKSNAVSLSFNTEKLNAVQDLVLTVFPNSNEASSDLLSTLEQQRNLLLKQADFSPDQIIDYMLKAKQARDWDKYFLYQDTEALMLKNADLNRQYKLSSPQTQQLMLTQFKDSIRKEVASNGREYIPTNYVIAKTSYTNTEAQVIVNADFQIMDYSESRRYTYTLSKILGIWEIVDIDVAIESARAISSGIYRAP